MMSHATIPKHLKHLLLPDAVLTATLLDNLIPIEIDGTLATKYVHHVGSNDADPSFVHHLRTWGEAGTVTIKSRVMQPKSADRDVNCMFIGYSRQHPQLNQFNLWIMVGWSYFVHSKQNVGKEVLKVHPSRTYRLVQKPTTTISIHS
jgi:hypothetical protein